MDDDRRRPAIIALTALANSEDYHDRVDAGRALASFADAREARESLLRLVLDANDTFVTYATAEALLRRHDLAGLAIIAEALASADLQHRTYVGDAVAAVFTMFASERDRAVEACDELSLDASAQVRQGSAELRDMLTEIRPLLHPQEPA
ncbi:hypothetical protein [Kribbella sp. CA-247076]|uniref:hypothetical protein n=1 Tax=Kribbella sp. CA-247076 TaxID=3239941 RepID=UPI003D9087D6